MPLCHARQPRTRALRAACAHKLRLTSYPLHACATAQCLSSKARHLAQYEMEDPRVLAIMVSLTGWEMEGVGEGPIHEPVDPAAYNKGYMRTPN